MRPNYCIDDDYISRNNPDYFNDMSYKDEWQDEVYATAFELAQKHNLHTILDIGCGSGYKLLKYFGKYPYQTIGTDVPETVQQLREKYPNRRWEISDFEDRSMASVDLIICSDVIEHVINPDELITLIRSINFKYLVISTPDRNLIKSVWKIDAALWNGPPLNTSHVREWTYEEFQHYLRDEFSVIQHIDSHIEHATQCAICVPETKATKEYSIIIPTYNHCDDLLKPCIESILRNTDMTNTEVVVVANGCTDNTREYVESLGEPFKLLWFDRPLGYTVATNMGICASSGQYLVLLNNDCLLQDWQEKNQWIDMLRQPFRADPLMGITGPTRHKNYPIDRYFMIFYCVMIHRSMFTELGLLDEIFSPGGGEDVDFTIKIEDAGYHSFRVPDNSFEWSYEVNFPIQHFAECTVLDGVNVFYEKWEDSFKQNQKTLEKMYGFVHYKSIGGWLSDNEAHILEELSVDKECIEIGSYMGKSSVCIAHVAKSVVCIDPFDCPDDGASHVSGRTTLDTFKEHTKWYDNITYHQMYSNEAAQYIEDNSADFIFVDGGHYYDHVMDDIAHYWSKLRVGGVMAFHDTYDDPTIWPNISTAIKDCLGTNREGLVDSIAWYRKKSDADLGRTFSGTIAVVMPMYNAERYIESAIISVQNQGYTDWKMFIVDNKSTDNSLQICRQKASEDARIVVIEHPFNSGIGGGRNVALRIIKDDPSIKFITFMDADDVWYESHFRENLRILGRTDYDAVYSDCEFRNAITDEQMWEYGIFHPEEFDSQQLRESNFIYVSFAIIKRHVFDAVGYFDETTEAYEDWDYWCRANLQHNFSFKHVRKVTGYYRVNDKSQYKDLQTAYANIKSRYALEEKPHTNNLHPELRPQDEYLHDEIFVRNVYGVKPEDMIDAEVLDVGGNVGFFTTLAHDLGAKKIIAVEPNPHAIEKFRMNTREYTNVILVEKAIFSKHIGNISVVEPDERLGTTFMAIQEGAKPFDITSISELLTYTTSDNRILKMDIEGSEYDAIFGTSFEDLRKFKTIFIEIHNNPWFNIIRNPLQTIENLVDYIKLCGFEQKHVNEDISWLTDDGFNVRSFSYRFDRIGIDKKTFNVVEGKQNIRVIAACHNEEKMLPFFLNHYTKFADVVIYDGHSTDRSREIIQSFPNTTIITEDNGAYLDDLDILMDIRNNRYKINRDAYDWQIVCDIDEILYHPNLLERLKYFTARGVTIPNIVGYEMVSLEFPAYNPQYQIYDLVKRGIADPEYHNKNIIFDPKVLDINYAVGCHSARPEGYVNYSASALYLLHYRRLSHQYMVDICEYKGSRISQKNKDNLLSGHYAHLTHEPEDAFREYYNQTINVIDEAMHAI